MYRTRYEFQAKYPQSISFGANEIVLGLRQENEHWLLVYHPNNGLGAVPSNYIDAISFEKGPNASTMIEEAISAIRKNEIFECETLLNYLQNLKASLLGENGCVRDFPHLPSRTMQKSKGVEQASSVGKNEVVEKQPLSPLQSRVDGVNLPPGISVLLVDALRSATNSTHSRCQHALQHLFKILSTSVPSMKGAYEALDTELLPSSIHARRSLYTKTSDWREMQTHISQLEARAKDLQENSWPLVDDDGPVLTSLNSFVELLCNISLDMARMCINDERLPNILSFLHQMEKKPTIRRFYLLIVIATISINPSIWQYYLESVMPLDIVRELRSANIDDLDYLLDLRTLTFLLDKGNSLPVNLQGELNLQFFQAVFLSASHFTGSEKIESCDLMTFSGDSTPIKSSSVPANALKNLHIGNGYHSALPASTRSFRSSTSSSLLMETFVSFILAANRHFHVGSVRNEETAMTPIMLCLMEKFTSARDLVENVLRRFNRNADEASSSGGISFVRTLRGTLHEETLSSSEIFYASVTLNCDVALQGSGSSSQRSSFSEDSDTSCDSQRFSVVDVVRQAAPDTPRNSTRKFLADVLSIKSTASLIYLNDVHVVVDVIIRKLCDLPPSSTDLPEYLFLMNKIILNSNYLQDSTECRVGDMINALRGVVYHAGQSTVKSFTTGRSVRLATGLINLLSSLGH